MTAGTILGMARGDMKKLKKFRDERLLRLENISTLSVSTSCSLSDSENSVSSNSQHSFDGRNIEKERSRHLRLALHELWVN
jgi:hypothetical protein